MTITQYIDENKREEEASSMIISTKFKTLEVSDGTGSTKAVLEADMAKVALVSREGESQAC